jgi:hypothetical protein
MALQGLRGVGVSRMPASAQRRVATCLAVNPRVQQQQTPISSADRPAIASHLLAAGLAIGISLTASPVMAAPQYNSLADIVRTSFGFVDENKDGVITKEELLRTSKVNVTVRQVLSRSPPLPLLRGEIQCHPARWMAFLAPHRHKCKSQRDPDHKTPCSLGAGPEPLASVRPRRPFATLTESYGVPRTPDHEAEGVPVGTILASYAHALLKSATAAKLRYCGEQPDGSVAGLSAPLPSPRLGRGLLSSNSPSPSRPWQRTWISCCRTRASWTSP